MINISTPQWYATISLFIWPFLRILGLIIAEPVLGNNNIPIRVKVGLALLMTLVIAPIIPPGPTVDPASPAGLFVAAQQLLIGTAMGFVIRIALTAVEAAGQLIGLQMGLGFAVFFDPQTSAQTAVVGQFLGMLAILTFLAVDGHVVLVTVLAQSFTAMPISAEPVSLNGFRVLLEWGSEIFRTGLMISLPVVAALLIANVAVGIMTRAAPQLNLFAVGFPITLGIGFLSLWLMVPFMGPAITKLFDQALTVMMQMVQRFR